VQQMRFVRPVVTIAARATPTAPAGTAPENRCSLANCLNLPTLKLDPLRAMCSRW
jgi:hypothetical protein